MNHYHVEQGNIIIPTFTDTILESITSRSFLELRSRLGCDIQQATIPLDEFIDKIKSGNITEAGGLGTAAVVSPVGEYIIDVARHREEGIYNIILNEGKTGPLSRKMFETLTAIQHGTQHPPQGWLQHVRHIK